MPIIPEVSVVIPTFNEKLHICNILSDLQNQTYKIKEIIVVDGGSKDNTVALAQQFPHVSTIVDKPSPARQRNIGWQQASTELIFFLDADTKCQRNFIELCVAELNLKNLDIACPDYIPLTDDKRIQRIYSFFNMLFYLGQWILPSGAGSCIITKKKILEKTYGFDETYQYDDIYFLRQAKNYGKFRKIQAHIYVSPRRFETYGIWTTFNMYCLLSICFIFGAYSLASRISYPFGNYLKK